MTLKERNQKLADNWINELSAAGYTYDEMIALFRNAKKKFLEAKKASK